MERNISPVRFQVSISQKEIVETPGLQPSFFGDVTIPIVYTGPSMNPTLSESDLLKVIPPGQTILSVGDVICFFCPEKNYNIVHRIIRITPNGYITQGDNNLYEDSNTVKFEYIVGKVISAWRSQYSRVIYGKKKGYYIFKIHQLIKRIKIGIFRAFQNFWPFSIIYKKILPLLSIDIKLRYIIFYKHQNKVIKIIYRDTMIGVYNARSENWSFKSIYGLFIDRNKLPIIRNIQYN